MRGLCKVSLALGLALLVAGPAMAQRGPGGRGGGIGMLLRNKSVQEELKLDKDQVDKLTAAFEKFREDNKDDFAKLGRDSNASREEREAAMKKIGEGSRKVAADVLKPEQMKRLKQIQVQQEGVRAFANPEVEKDLKLTDKQKDELKTIAEDLQKQQREIFQNAGGNREEARKKMTDLRKEKMDAALKVLTDEQKKTYKELTGAHFEIKFERRPQ
jgi:Spy/CpxP family protein refolding chaperone